MKMMENSQICKFYSDQKVLITGGTGFMGKILIEKLLRCTNVSTIFLLIREKKGKDANSRLDDTFDNIIFTTLRKECPNFRHRLVAIVGDCSISGLGLSITDRQTLISEVNIVFHVAATVRFEENLKLAYNINVNGTSGVLELCRQIRNLKAVVHVSTAYSNCHLDFINETFYDCPDYEKIGSVLEKLSYCEADRLTHSIIGNWPNTYTFTKALAESLINNTAGSLPIAVFRPSQVISTYKEPMESWIDNLYGSIGVLAYLASGLLRVFPCDINAVADLVPVDTCVAGIIAAAWNIANRTTLDDIPIFNYVSSVENPITWREYLNFNTPQLKKYPLQCASWNISYTTIKNKTLYNILKTIQHLVPALLFDSSAVVIGQKPYLVSTYKKIHKICDVLYFFSTRDWQYKNDNVVSLWKNMNSTDKRLFPLSITTVSWDMYFCQYFKGIRVHLLNDPLSTLDKAKAKMRKFNTAHEFLKFLLVFIGVKLIWTNILGIKKGMVK